MLSDKPINYTGEAFFHPGNLGFLFCAMLVVLFADGTGQFSDIFLSVVFGVELLFLGIVPRSKRFQKSVKIRKLRERNSAFGEREVYERLDPAGQRRFLVLKHISGMIKENFGKMAYTSQGMLENIYTKIQGLLTNYIINLEMLQRYHRYLNSSSLKTIGQEIDTVTEDLDQTTSEKLKEIKARRLSILRKRLEKVDSAREKYLICESQLETIEDAIRYIYEKSMTMTNPEEIGFQLDNLINDLEETATMMGDLEDDLPPTFSILNKLEEEEASVKKKESRVGSGGK